MWFVFPQLAGLGRSATAQRYAIGSLEEARAYLAHPLLGARLRECAVRSLAAPADLTADEILGDLDALKLRSSMTLFLRAAPDEPLFQGLDRFYGGELQTRRHNSGSRLNMTFRVGKQTYRDVRSPACRPTAPTPGCWRSPALCASSDGRATFSQEELGRRAGIHPNHVGRIERGTKDLRVTTLLTILKALDAKPGEVGLPQLDDVPIASHEMRRPEATRRQSDDLVQRLTDAERLLRDSAPPPSIGHLHERDRLNRRDRRRRARRGRPAARRRPVTASAAARRRARSRDEGGVLRVQAARAVHRRCDDPKDGPARRPGRAGL